MHLLQIFFFTLITTTWARPHLEEVNEEDLYYWVYPYFYSHDIKKIKGLYVEEDGEVKSVIKNDTITLHFSKTETDTPLSLAVNATATFDNVDKWNVDKDVDITSLGTLAVGDYIYVYVSFETTATNARTVLPYPDYIMIRVPYRIADQTIDEEDFTGTRDIEIYIAVSEKTIPRMKLVLTTSPTLSASTVNFTTAEFDHDTRYAGVDIEIDLANLKQTLDLKLYSTVYIFLLDVAGPSLLEKPATIFITEECDFYLNNYGLIVGTKKILLFGIRHYSYDATANQVGAWRDTVKVKLTLDRPTPTNGEVEFNAQKIEDNEWEARNIDISALGTLKHEGRICVFVSTDGGTTYSKGFREILTFDDPKFTFPIEPTSIIFSDLALPPRILMDYEETGYVDEPIFQLSYTKDGTTTAIPVDWKWDEEDEDIRYFILPDLTTFGITNDNLPADLCFQGSITEGASWDTPCVNLAVTPDFTLDPSRILPSQIAKTPVITIGGERASWGETLKAKFTHDTKSVDAPVTATGNKPSRTITIAAGQDLTGLGLSKFPAVVHVHLSIDGSDTFLASTARLTVGEGEERALGVAPLTGMLAALALLFIALL